MLKKAYLKVQNLQYKFLELFRTFISFGDAVCPLERLGPIDRTPGIPGSDKKGKVWARAKGGQDSRASILFGTSSFVAP